MPGYGTRPGTALTSADFDDTADSIPVYRDPVPETSRHRRTRQMRAAAPVAGAWGVIAVVAIALVATFVVASGTVVVLRHVYPARGPAVTKSSGADKHALTPARPGQPSGPPAWLVPASARPAATATRRPRRPASPSRTPATPTPAPRSTSAAPPPATTPPPPSPTVTATSPEPTPSGTPTATPTPPVTPPVTPPATPTAATSAPVTAAPAPSGT